MNFGKSETTRDTKGLNGGPSMGAFPCFVFVKTCHIKSLCCLESSFRVG